MLDTGSPPNLHHRGHREGTHTGQLGFDSLRTTYRKPRSWGGFPESAPRTLVVSVRLSVQFFYDDEPTASLAVWAYIVPDGAMGHSILFGRDSWML